MVWGKLDLQKNETRPLCHTIQKNNSKCIKVLNVRPETIKLIEENMGRMLFDIDLSNVFLGISCEARETKANK